MAVRPAPQTLSLYLLACTVGSPDGWASARSLFAGMDDDAWLWVLNAGRAHGLAGLLARNLDWAARALALRIPVLDALAAERRQILAQLLVRRAAARTAMEALVRRDIRFVLFKGLSLAEEIYGDLSLRYFNDCDLLVEEHQVDAAVDALAVAGFRAGRFGGPAVYRAHGHHAIPLMNQNGQAVDLHWELSGRELGHERADVFWENTYAPPGAKLPGLRLTPEMNFIYLSTHFYWDSFAVFKSLLDAYMAARTAGDGIDANRTRMLAERLNRTRIVRLAALLCARDFVPLKFISVLAEGHHSPQAAMALRVLNRSRLARISDIRHNPNPMLRIALAGGLDTAGAAFRSVLLPTRTELAQRFGRQFEFTMYPTYYARQAFRTITGSNKAFFEFDDK